MKYTRLPNEELQKLEKDFIEFLVINGITAEDWIAIKENEPLHAERIIEQFSDVVWEGVLRKVNYLVKEESNSAYYFKCNAENIELIRLMKNTDKTLQQNASKKYIKPREEELFEMIKNGCVISDGENFKSLF